MQKIYTIALLLCILLLSSQAQNAHKGDSLSTYQRIDASYIFGGQVYKNNFIYKPGLSFQASYGIRLNESVSIGAGMGYVNLKDEHFMPLFIEAIGCRKNRLSSPMIKMQIGYAAGWDTGDLKPEGYRFGGGIYIDVGMGRKIPVNNDYSLYFHWSYRHQFARTDYEIYGGQSYTEALNYDMIVISLGLIRHCQ